MSTSNREELKTQLIRALHQHLYDRSEDSGEYYHASGSTGRSPKVLPDRITYDGELSLEELADDLLAAVEQQEKPTPPVSNLEAEAQTFAAQTLALRTRMKALGHNYSMMDCRKALSQVSSEDEAVQWLLRYGNFGKLISYRRD